MYLPKQDIYTALKGLEDVITGLKVYQVQPEEFTDLPVITFYVGNNSVETDLNNNITYQDITIIVDIWGKTSSESSQILNKVEETMRENLYSLEYSADVPNIDEQINHINCRFTNKI